MKVANRLTKFFEELRELPGRFSDVHMQEFCEQFLMQRSGFEAARIPVKAESRRTAPARRPRQRP
jgi:hypothetical protein